MKSLGERNEKPKKTPAAFSKTPYGIPEKTLENVNNNYNLI